EDVGAVVVVDVGDDHRVTARHIVLDYVGVELDRTCGLIASSGQKKAKAESRDKKVTHHGIAPQDRISLTTTPCTSVKRISRPPKGKVSGVWSSPSRCSAVACRSCTVTLFSMT